jgi:hypothetical protein
MDAAEFGLELIVTARSYSHVVETAPNTDNGGPIDQWLAAVNCPPGNAWCAAAACAWVRETGKRLGVSFDFKPSASALGVLHKNTGLVVEDVQPGDLIIWDHGKGLGHIGVVTSTVEVDGVLGGISAIAGNTSKDGKSRNGTMVADHPVNYPDPKIAGFVRIIPQT